MVCLRCANASPSSVGELRLTQAPGGGAQVSLRLPVRARSISLSTARLATRLRMKKHRMRKC